MRVPFRPLRARPAICAGVLSLALATGASAQMPPPAALQAPQSRSVDAIPDVIEDVIESVVLISTSQVIANTRSQAGNARPGEKDPDGSAPDAVEPDAGKPDGPVPDGAVPDESEPDAGPAERRGSAPSGVPDGQSGPAQPGDEPLDEFFEDFFNRDGGGEERTRPTGEGSGFVIDAGGTIVTNFHVVDGADRIEVGFNDGTKLAARVLGRDREADLAVLKVDAPRPLKFVRFGDSERLRVGEVVLAMGNPFGIGLSATSGIVSGRNRDMRTGRYDNFIQTDASINKGNSGGPLFNLAGEVVGVNTAILSPTGGSVGIGFAVPASTVAPVVQQIVEFGEARRGYIGVRIQDLPEEMVKSLGLAGGQGALIAGVVEGGPAAEAGVKVGDVVVSFDGRPVANSRAFQRIVADVATDREVEAVLLRDSKKITATIKVGRLEDDEANLPAKPERAAPEPAMTLLGLGLVPLDPEVRRQFKIDESVKGGAVIVAIGPDSPLKDQKLSIGDTITNLGERPLASPEELAKRLAGLKGEGQSSALALIAGPDGELRYLRVPVE